MDGGRWSTDKDFHEDARRVLGFPDYYGANLDAFNDCLGDLPPHGEGTVLVFQHFDRFVQRDRPVAQAVLDIVARTSRGFLVGGRRMLALVQSDDPEIRFEPVGCLHLEPSSG